MGMIRIGFMEFLLATIPSHPSRVGSEQEAHFRFDCDGTGIE
jgi:hypothetical protein